MIGTKLKEIRENTGMNKKEFADYIGIKYSTYNNYETEAREPASDFLILISTKFDVSIDYLLGMQDTKDITHAYQLKSTEYEHIKKYRALDSHGKEMVDFTLEKEWERSTVSIETNCKTVLKAAHERTDIKVTDEMRKHDDAIMNDDSEWE